MSQFIKGKTQTGRKRRGTKEESGKTCTIKGESKEPEQKRKQIST